MAIQYNAKITAIRKAVTRTLLVTDAQIIKVEEWANVIWAKVVFKGKTICRFVSKKVKVSKPVAVTMYNVKLNSKKFTEALAHVKSFADSKYNSVAKTWSVNAVCFDSALMTDAAEPAMSLEYEMYNPNGRYYG